ncbi:uncharacterized protein LOC130367763 isoform X2 [Hyla sarda]|uniref:uncharacterized protein LOC130367763 isoform X2 n=1 Tax=Hyla sarda TaxID=327740 RepID=UPI0024C23270|nr:uncharacterized protein LOC130367763 isoform X2 [Hyla sarda]XP_056426483.1 uncharacterized protein LOC130367763 isoform X2 [Hyla sarda]
MKLLIFLGLIWTELLVVTSEYLPPPELSLMTSETIYMGQKVQLQCTAPIDCPEGTFYLILNSTDLTLQKADAPETKNSVMFTIETSYTLHSMEYVCRYKCFVESVQKMSEVSNVLTLNISVPVWVFVVVGLLGLVILVALVIVPIFLGRIKKKKKQEKRDKGSIWIDQQKTPDLPDGKDNMVFSLNYMPKTDISPTYMGHTDSQTDKGLDTPFSTFRT